MSDTVAGWLFGGWLFGTSDRASGSDRIERKSVTAKNSVRDGHEDRQVVEVDTIDGTPVSALLVDLQAGSRDALATLYVALRPSLWRLAMILTRSEETADEIVQNVFLALWGRRAALAAEDDIRAYLNTAVRNAASNVRRQARVRERMDLAVERATCDPPALGQPFPRPDQAAEASDFYAAYRRALAALNDREQIALQLRWETDSTFETIGQMIGLSKVAARTVVLRAEAKVRALLDDYRV